MRFDDMIATVLAQPADREDRLAARWRQLVDLLAQSRGEGDKVRRAEAVGFLRSARDRVPPNVRREAALSLAGLQIDPALLHLFTEDRLDVAAPLLAGVRLSSDQWLDLLPRLQPSARALLRHRRDLGPDVERALASFGASDLILEGKVFAKAAAPAAPAPTTEAGSGGSQIRDLVERIEAYRRHREAQKSENEAMLRAEPVESFRWEAAGDGLLAWVEGAPREALIGQSIAVIAGPAQFGVDGQAAGAFEKRAPFRDARFSVAGAGPTAGQWRISGVPFFDPVRGSFLGYRGQARRPRLDETAPQSGLPSGSLFGPRFPADSLRQLVHELRTPLNAIIGFAEMIEGQHLGPAAQPYRGRAETIVEQAQALLAAVEDLDTAARLETQRFDLEDGLVDAAALVERLHTAYRRIAEERGAELRLDLATGLPPATVDPQAAERMVARLLAATIGVAGAGEHLSLLLAGDDAGLVLSVDRPAAIRGLGERDLLDPGYTPEGDWPDAPALGLGFALRLVRNLAEAAGGSLDIGDALISLHLPGATRGAGSDDQRESAP